MERSQDKVRVFGALPGDCCLTHLLKGGKKGFLERSRRGGVVLEALLHQHRNRLEKEVVVPRAGGVLADTFQVAVQLAQHHLKNAVQGTVVRVFGMGLGVVFVRGSESG